MGGLGSIEGLEFQSLRFVFSSEAEEGVEDAFEGLRGARPDAGKGLAMNRQIADQVANRVGAEIDIAQSRIAAHGQRRVACWRKAQAGLVSPVVDERFEMLPAADAHRSRVSARNSLPSRSERKGIVHAGLVHLWSMAVSSLLFCGTLAREIPPIVHARGRRSSQ